MKKLFIFLAFVFIPVYSSAESLSNLPTNTACTDKVIMGNIENVNLLEKNITLQAKLDTGAGMSSLSAENIEVFEKNNQNWVRFTLNFAQEKVIFTERLIRHIAILKREEEKSDNMDLEEKYTKRPVISLLVCLGNQKRNILINLTDRRRFHYPLLLGTNALKDFRVLVDVDRNYISSLHCPNAYP